MATELEARRILKAELSKPHFERRTLWQTTLGCSFTLCLLKIPHALKTLEFLFGHRNVAGMLALLSALEVVDPAGHCRFKGAGGGGALRIFTPRIAVSGERVSFLTNLSSRMYAIRSR
ncbi:hypothetical protein [Candidatus Binatus sp.]|uniref:hypothetical protein n=1 Tax=Candidatus Binatus sp. TaxID=2811406 RepID=UPI002F955D54